MSATVFAVLFGTSVALNVWLWFRSEHYREQTSLPHQSDSLPMDARVFWDIESRTVQDSHIITISDEDWKVKS